MSSHRSELAEPSPDNQVEFGQEELAEFVVDEIENDPDIQIAINGPWGSGKTTILKKAHQNIKEDSSNISVWYEPWRYSPDQTTLRRTFLKSVYETASEDIEQVDPIDKENYHFPNIKGKSKGFLEFLKSFKSSMVDQAKLILSFILFIGLLLFFGELVRFLDLGLAGGLIISVAQLFAFALIISLVFYIRDGLVSELTGELTYDVREPKISEIDLFEDKYSELLSEIGNKNKNLVVFIDDLDRCNTEEIREVITALSTYLDPDTEQAPVSIVTAIDGPKVVDSFEDNSKNTSQMKPNILNKTFQIVLPVPSLSRSDVQKIIKQTAEDLDYPISEENVRHITRISVIHAESNLRIIRSALSDLIWIKKIGESYLSNSPFRDSESFSEIMDNDYILFRISLVKILSKNEDLRKFVTDPSMWINKDEREGDIPWDIFELPPEFSPDGIDPRPLLALNSPNDSIGSVQDFDRIKSEVTSGRNPEFPKEVTEKYVPAARVDIAHRLLDIDLDEHDDDVKYTIVNAVIDLLYDSIDAVDDSQSKLVSTCYQVVNNNKNIVSDISRSEYPKWILLCSKISDDLVGKLFEDTSPFMNRDRNRFLKSVSNKDSVFDKSVIEMAIDAEIREVERGNEVQSARRIADLFGQRDVTEVESTPKYIIKLVQEWSFSNNPDGPPESMMNENIISILHSDEYVEQARTVFTKVGSQGDAGREYLDVLLDSGWPEPTDFDSSNSND